MFELFRNAWAQAISALLGVWLMAAPAVLGYAGLASDIHRIVGPVAAGIAFVALWPHVRSLRWTNLGLGAVLVLAPLFAPFDAAAAWNSVAVGALLAGLAFVRGTVDERFGGGWWALWTGDVAGEAGEEH